MKRVLSPVGIVLSALVNSKLCRFVQITITLVLSTAMATVGLGQTVSGLIGISPSGSYDSTKFDSVSLTSGNLALNIPLISYQQRGSLHPYTLSLRYNNQNWQLRYYQDGVPGGMGETYAVTYGPGNSYNAEFGVQLGVSTGGAMVLENLAPCSQTEELLINNLPCELQAFMAYDTTGGAAHGSKRGGD